MSIGPCTPVGCGGPSLRRRWIHRLFGRVSLDLDLGISRSALERGLQSSLGIDRTEASSLVEGFLGDRHSLLGRVKIGLQLDVHTQVLEDEGVGEVDLPLHLISYSDLEPDLNNMLSPPLCIGVVPFFSMVTIGVVGSVALRFLVVVVCAHRSPTAASHAGKCCSLNTPCTAALAVVIYRSNTT
jgi:hypothetical protein